MASFFNLTLDTLAPAGLSLILNDGAQYATSATVTAKISVSDETTTGYQMKIWGTKTAGTEAEASWETFATTKSITLPDGEQIMDICTNAVPSTSSAVVDDDQLLIATYNPAATDRKPGSLYIYNLKTLEQVKKYEGICEKPVAVTYKFPTSN